MIEYMEMRMIDEASSNWEAINKKWRDRKTTGVGEENLIKEES